MGTATPYYLMLGFTLAAYFIASKFVFDKVHHTTRTVIDELFHIPQGLSYCRRNFVHWDPKITTLPGLYLVSAAFLGTYFPCTTYNLRFINLLASCVNLLLFASILKFVYTSKQSKIVIQALNLTLLPPLYFFSHVYYTDTLSLTFLLAFSRLCLTNRHGFLMLVFGVFSVLMRQTNIVWIAMVFGHKFLDLFIRSSRVFGNQYVTNIRLSKKSLIANDVDTSKLKRYYDIMDVFYAIKYHASTCFKSFFRYLNTQDILTLSIHSVLLMFFVAFVYYNGSIVLGDKKAHEASVHVPQLLYFLIFYAIFGMPYVILKLKSTLILIFSNKFKVILLVLLMLAIVHYNTIIHPYLLADNRHFTFYIWNRWYGKYEYAKYATIPLYIFLTFNLYDNLKDQNCISFLLPYTVAIFLAVALQRMIEVRYFLIPFIILRLRFSRPSSLMILIEFCWYLLLNVLAFQVFFTREVIWKDFDEVQRIIW